MKFERRDGEPRLASRDEIGDNRHSGQHRHTHARSYDAFLMILEVREQKYLAD
ncbi:MAG TPA: hypothetical protein VFB34_12885 [Chloroflexota bacterium]|nr:hypothetical protein [Chloroflexota bacterium]